MKTYDVMWEIEVDAEDYLSAAKEALNSIVNGSSKVFNVTDRKTKKMVSVDLDGR